MKTRTRHSFEVFHPLEGPTVTFGTSVGLLAFVVRQAFKNPSILSQDWNQRPLIAAVSNLEREWSNLEGAIVAGAPGTGTGTEYVEQAVCLVEFVEEQGFGQLFDEHFPDESEAIHCAAASMIDNWRKLAKAIAEGSACG